MQYYKVVKKLKDGKYVSAFAKGLSAVEYGTDILTRQPEWLTGTEFGLTVFDSLEDAIDYKNSIEFLDGGDFSIFRASVDIPVRKPPKSIIGNKNLTDGFLIRASGSWPLGTVMTNGVVLLEEVT